MQFGTMNTPSHPSQRGLAEGHYHNLDYLEFLDQLGADEAWIGSHYTVVSEPQAPNDLLIAQAIPRTKRIRLNPGAFIVPFFHPAELAHRIAWLDHISGGRIIVGIGASGVPTDLDLFGIDYKSNQSREMLEESLNMMRDLWASTEPTEFKGKYWTVRHPEPKIDGRLQFHMRPLQQPHPRFAITGASPNSPTLKLAGRYGLIPSSFCFGVDYIRSHWDSVVEGADAAGREPPPKSDWRIVRDVIVAETDKEALDFAINGPMGQHFGNFYLPMLKEAGLLKSLKHRPEDADSDVTVEYLAKYSWTVGSEATVHEKLSEIYDRADGFGVLVANSYDHLDCMEQWRSSIRVLATDIVPKLSAEKAAPPQAVAAE
ncbi:MAG: Flavin-dependent oxidoreductase, luciferase family [Bradyrhizobium sp.]|nr:Flavin-dependent oxidoreductase, luciferase family [Bradyrhizobium sp.]